MPLSGPCLTHTIPSSQLFREEERQGWVDAGLGWVRGPGGGFQRSWATVSRLGSCEKGHENRA